MERDVTFDDLRRAQADLYRRRVGGAMGEGRESMTLCLVRMLENLDGRLAALERNHDDKETA